jgi:hypothetical protein
MKRAFLMVLSGLACCGGLVSGSTGGSGSTHSTQSDSGTPPSSPGHVQDDNDGGSPPPVYVDAGLYRGDGSFFVDGGAYPDEGTAHGGIDAGSTSIVATGIRHPPNHLVSDGSTLFWTNFKESAGLLAIPVGGGPITRLLSGIVQLVDVDDLNLYVIVATSLGQMGTGEVQIFPMENASLLRIPKNGAAATRISGGGEVWAATTLTGTVYWVESTATGVVIQSSPLQGGPVSPIKELSRRTVLTDMDLMQGFTQIGVTETTVFLGGQGNFSAYFPLVGQGPSLAPPKGGKGWTGVWQSCESFTSDTAAVYCHGTDTDAL